MVRISPIEYKNINLYGKFGIDLSNLRQTLLRIFGRKKRATTKGYRVHGNIVSLFLRTLSL